MMQDYPKQFFIPFIETDSSIILQFIAKLEAVLIKPTTIFTRQHSANIPAIGTDSIDNNAHHLLSGICLLVAEDIKVNQLIIKGFLQRLNIKIDIANDGLEVLQLIEKNSYDAVLMDMHMPKMGGIEATKKIRQEKRFQDLPIIALTANTTPEERDKCLECGMNDFLAKPVNFEELTQMLCLWIHRSR